MTLSPIWAQNDPEFILSNCEMIWMTDYFETFGQHIRSLRQVTCQDKENMTHNIIELDLPECSTSDSGPLPEDSNDEGKNL